MPRYIDADALIKKIFPLGMFDNGNYAVNARAVKKAIDSIPTADVVPTCEGELRGGSFYFQLEEAIESSTRFMREHDAEVAREIFERLHAHRKFDGHTVSIWLNDLICIAKEYGIDLDEYDELKKKYIGEQNK